MRILDIDELESLTKKVLSYSKSEWAEISASSGYTANLRYAANTVTTSGSSENTSLTITAVNGKRAGSSSTNDLSDDGLRRAVRRAEEIASLAPENPELMPPLTTKQEYMRSAGFDARSADTEWGANERARIAGQAINEAKAHSFITAGFLETDISKSVYRNSKGLVVGDKSTRTTFSTTMRNTDGSSSGWNKRASHALAMLDADSAILRASEKCTAWSDPQELDPGVYKAILEPSATADMIQQLSDAFDARESEEGRSAFSRANGGTALGEKIVNEKVHIYSDPSHPVVPAGISGESGLAVKPTEWILDGKLQNLIRSRYWADKTGKAPLPGPTNIIMDGGTMLPDDFLTTVKEGLLITSFWYIRNVDEQTLLRTGLTRDGLYWVQDGKIVNGVKNFRWNESPIAMLNNLIDMSRPVVTAPRDGWDGTPMYVPMVYVSGFNFASLSDAI
jgi:predicted Zn-dependent protease